VENVRDTYTSNLLEGKSLSVVIASISGHSGRQRRENDFGHNKYNSLSCLLCNIDLHELSAYEEIT
jgi:hypothetical protein